MTFFTFANVLDCAFPSPSWVLRHTPIIQLLWRQICGTVSSVLVGGNNHSIRETRISEHM